MAPHLALLLSFLRHVTAMQCRLQWAFLGRFIERKLEQVSSLNL
jgi:hypothetical protein